MENKNIINGNCWVAYFDILGFKKKVTNFENQNGEGSLGIFVKYFYDEIINELKQQSEYHPDKVFITWFSDTFMFFTRDDSVESFSRMHKSFDISCRKIISTMKPLRGAIGFGQLYADISKNLFLGSGIVNAYEYAEKQNWIGYIVTREANNRLNELGVDLSRWKTAFMEYPVPFHQKGEKDKTLKLFVSKIHYNYPAVISAVKLMQQESMKDEDYQEKHRIKYENTLKFFEENP